MKHADALETGSRLEEYEVEGILGAGGFGITYKATDVNLDLRVAIKEYLPRDLASRAENSSVIPKSEAEQENFAWGLGRFMDEARTLAKFRRNLLGHPVHSAGPSRALRWAFPCTS